MSKKNNDANESFWKIAAENSQTVETWPEWMREIRITSTTANSGSFAIIKYE